MLRWQSKWNENFLSVSSFFLFLLLTIPRLAFFFPSSKFDHLLPSSRSNEWKIPRTNIKDRSEKCGNVLHPRGKLSNWNQVEEKTRFVTKCQNRDNQPLSNRRLIYHRASTGNVFIFSRTYDPLFFVERNSSTCERSRSNCFHSRSPRYSSSPFPSVLLLDRFRFRCKFFARSRRVLREAASGMASFNIGNSCPITIFHRGLDAASNHHRCGGRFCVYQRVPPAACCWLYELKRGILMSAGEGRFAKGRGISIPVNIDGVKKKKRRERNRDDDFEKFADSFWFGV